MSRLTQTVAASHTLAIAAAEEASRFGVHDVDIDHVFLAVVISAEPAGQALRDLGVTLDAARDAVAAQHRDQLASLGIEAELPGDGQIRFTSTGGYDWNDRALFLLSRAGESGAVLRALLAESSGTIAGILARLEISPDEVRDQLARAEREAVRAEAPVSRLSRAQTIFVPASPRQVWDLVADPLRLPEWQQNLDLVEAGDAGWIGRTRTVAPGGKPLRVKPQLRRQLIARIANSESSEVHWRMSYPDAPTANARVIVIGLEPAPGGTRVRIQAGWERNSGAGRAHRLIAPVTSRVMYPVVRVMLWVQLSALATAISRVLRAG